MIRFKKKHYRYFAILIVIALMLPTYGMIQGVVAGENSKAIPAVNQLSSQDKEIVNEISNMTGVKAEEIIKLKTQSNTWNDILDKLKNNSGKDTAQERIGLLAEVGLEADYIKKLRDEGFENNRIIEAKALVDRVTSQLKQILDADKEMFAPSAPAQSDAGNQDSEAYRELADKIDTKTGLYLLLKLEKDFGSMEKVLDEYLLSLQIGIDLNKYITDKKAYEKDKSEQSAKFDMTKIITMETIEAKVLGSLQNDNKSKSNSQGITQGKKPDVNNAVNGIVGSDNLPVSPLPDVQNSKPQNPQDDVMKEINGIKDKSLNVEGR